VSRPATRFTRLVGVDVPIVQAPMANGPSTVELAAAVCEAGALGSLAGAALPPDELRAQIRELRSRTSRPFAVNVFAALPPARPDDSASAAWSELLAPVRERHGVPAPPPPAPPPWRAEDQLAVVLEERPPVFSFAFGIPPLDEIREAGIVTIGTATTPAEAVALEQAGADVVCAQGAEAGGHRGSFLGSPSDALTGLVALVPQVADAVSVPVLAAGGIVDGRGIAAALALGAEGVQLGTAFLFCPESGAGDDWRRALREHETAIIDVYTGRAARGARTPFVALLEESGLEPLPYPFQRAVIGDLRDVDGHGLYLGGQAARAARELPAAELVRTLAAEAEAATS